MKLAVMQPYFFPYLGYFQLIHAVDVFVSFDDVTYIKRGWINRNFLLMNCRPQRFTVPLSGASQFRRVDATPLANIDWQSKFLKSLRQAYSRAPQFATVFAKVEALLRKKRSSVAELALDSVKTVVDHVGLKTTIRTTSKIYDNADLKGQERILDICRREDADTYINLPGGKALYDREAFAARGVNLRFIKMEDVRYRQFQCEFVPNLSILDVLMFNAAEAVRELLQRYSLDQ